VTLRSLPVDDPQRLVVLHTDYDAPGSRPGDGNESIFSFPIYRDLRDRDPAFSGVIARMGAGVTLVLQAAIGPDGRNRKCGWRASKIAGGRAKV